MQSETPPDIIISLDKISNGNYYLVYRDKNRRVIKKKRMYTRNGRIV